MLKPLDKSLRNQLEATVKKAREIAEKAAHSALEQLGVGAAVAFTHLSENEKKLRRQLRVHGRQLGDVRDPQKETQELGRLVEEVGYEHWHRMLFARFLAENNLLMYPDPTDPVPVSLEECEDLAADEEAKNGWELAARYAGEMLPQIFRLDSPAFTLNLPPEHQQALEKLLTDLPVETFEASDSLGWVYQFWQAKKKDEVNASEVKIGARELPAVTQLFTEPYMVDFLLDNSLGSWWAARQLTTEDFRTAKSENELREKASIDGVELKYLRFVQDEEDVWSLASGAFEQWPDDLAKLKTLDPSCGSGHFLVAAMLMLIPMRMQMEEMSASEAVNAVLRDNINGLDIDPRVTEIAAFALAITAWRVGGYQNLPELNIACSGLSVSAKKSEWLALAEGNQELEGALDKLYDLFKDAPVLGSLLNPSQIESSLFSSGYDNVAQLLEDALKNEQNDVSHEAGITAYGMAKSASLMVEKYDWIVTNVPFLGAKRQHAKLRNYCEQRYPVSSAGLETVFIERMLEMVKVNGSISFVSNQTWTFQPSSKKLREKLLNKNTFSFMVRLGAKAFETISGEVVNVCLSTISKGTNDKKTALLYLDLQDINSPKEKAKKLLSLDVHALLQKKIIDNDGSVFTALNLNKKFILSNLSVAASGLKTGDRDRFNRNFWEIGNISKSWDFFIVSSKQKEMFTGRNEVIFWEEDNGTLSDLAESLKHLNHVVQNYKRGQTVWKDFGIAVSSTGKIESFLYTGEKFDSGITVVKTNEENMSIPLYAYCESGEFEKNLRQIDSKLGVTTSTTLKVPFDSNYWFKIAADKYPNGLPKAYSDDLTQWVFHGHPCASVIWDENIKWINNTKLRTNHTVLQVAVARLLGYKWPAELDEEMELSDEARSLIEKSKTLNSHADEDGIVCIPAIRGEQAADERVLSLLASAYGDEWSNDVLSQLLSEVGMSSKTLDVWLREKFFTQHCKLFGHRPFIWHIWDGLKDGFSALVNYHKLDFKTLETLIYTYLGDWIIRQKKDIENGIDGAAEKLAAAEQLKVKLERILVGEQPHDIFVRWKSLEEQSIGWNPDINDGVRMNIRPFMTAPDVAKKGAGVLRDKPNIKWGKDRGKDVESAPWYRLGLEYEGKEGDRINEHHLSLEEKQAARENKG